MFFFNKPVLFDCGHFAKQKSRIEILGEIKKIVFKKNDPLKHCPKCLAKMATRCVKCGKIIFPGDPITFYNPEEIGFKYSWYCAVIVNEKKISVVGCVSGGCSEFACCVGYWNAPNDVQLLRVVEKSDNFIHLE
jgi:hypothetical protein